MKDILQKRIFPGFRIIEAIAWLLFHISWPLLLAIIFKLAGRFNDPTFMTAGTFLRIQGVVITVKAVYLLPFWWLFFIKLKEVSLRKKIILHIPCAGLYTGVALGSIYYLLTAGLHRTYTGSAMTGDIYNLMLAYFSYFTLFHAYNFYLHIKEQAKKESELRELAYQSEITALKAQIEPHFLFNTLNSISASVPASMEKTRVLIAQLADTFRYALRVSERQTVALEEEIAFVKTWLALEQHRFGKRLSVHYDIDSAALNTQVPSLILQPLVENAIKHGISPLVSGGTVTLSCKVENDFVQLSVNDTGIGYTGDLKAIFDKGVGLKNTARRLEYFYNQQLWIDRNSNGLSFSFKIPLAV
ncbi:MAG: histidine kinase [Chitinophaga sp.]|uniref:sensor histidine kinase n=1 Tax=Chitinophaga sp. TaxID=1869181 RepID=UPI001B19DDFE|nr:histidine kinase [Chitinophaga sp.]MBO9732058.1 histidine kinase [Chitinophaga sp.]